jgi:hypothetical protein
MNANGASMKVVYTVVERAPGKSFWTRVGIGFVNRDGSMNLRLDAIPVNGTLQVRDWDERDSLPRPQGGPSPSSMPRTVPRPESATASSGPRGPGMGSGMGSGLGGGSHPTTGPGSARGESSDASGGLA